MILGRLIRRLKALVLRHRLERELDEELLFHLEHEIEQNLRAGMSPKEARQSALRDFGGLEQSKEECRDARGIRLIEDVLQDVRYGLRTLSKIPCFTLVAVFTLALGIGANTAIFSVFNGVLLKALPYPDPDRLVTISETSSEIPVQAVSYQDYLDWRSQQTVFESMAARMPAGGVITGDGEPQRVIGRFVTASFFPTLGISPQIGRFFSESEDEPGTERVIVLSYGLWQRRFGGDPRVVGHPIQFNGESWTVVGVLPSGFDFYGQSNQNNDFLIPLGRLTDQSFMRDRKAHTVFVTGRLKRGVSIDHARSEMSTLAARLSAQFPTSNSGTGVTLRSMLDDYVGDTRPTLVLLTVAGALVLLVACANIANLLLARATTRQKEMAIRVALGAGRRRILSQLLTESMLLALAGGTLGLLLSWGGGNLLLKLLPDGLPRLEEVSLDWNVVCFTLLITVLIGIVFGLAPALHSTKVDLGETLKGGSLRSTVDSGGRRLRNTLVVIEVALSLALLVSSGLLFKSFWRLKQVDPGFDPHNVLTMRLRLPDGKYRESSQITTFLGEVKRHIETLPGVQKVSLATGFPLGRTGMSRYWIEGQAESQRTGDWPVGVTQAVSGDYHQTLGISLLAGRNFNEHDTANAPEVVIIDEGFVRRQFPGSALTDVLGKRIRFAGEGEPWREIVGVVRHVRQNGLDEEGGVQIYQPWLQLNPKSMVDYARAMDFIVRTSDEPLRLVEPIKAEVQSIDKDQPLGNIQTLEGLISQSIAPRRFNLLLLCIFAAIALVLGAVGLYGVLSYLVTQRTREIGIRMALGAQKRDVRRMIIKHGMKLVLAGVGLGGLVAVALTHLMANMLYNVSPTDPPTFILITLVLLGFALLACYVPARRATQVDPLTALRHE